MARWSQDGFIHSRPSKKKDKTYEGKHGHSNHSSPHPTKFVCHRPSIASEQSTIETNIHVIHKVTLKIKPSQRNVTFPINYPNSPLASYFLRTNTSTNNKVIIPMHVTVRLNHRCRHTHKNNTRVTNYSPPLFFFPSKPLQSENKPPNTIEMQHAFIVVPSFYLFFCTYNTISSEQM
ncbi:hypothetical protein COCSADRAFT_246326 [Bipolaris sorokiniana ND90Pr]|uniref:Uncharacterized protein n=1 Tax=Cochliobolus sativus (strain ND90Pr / ATCC 201652) TaxID=665912 RepID=M2SST7_COCSN|nr:uncharacterized protein COCSADRAFT_246326 [Bipolaris sorokiniana ND90Pr]EMD59867.1 hypothetical protein COCSADRAFT_246326 [Bipolaris sorokiniana ND90Pr]